MSEYYNKPFDFCLEESSTSRRSTRFLLAFRDSRRDVLSTSPTSPPLSALHSSRFSRLFRPRRSFYGNHYFDYEKLGILGEQLFVFAIMKRDSTLQKRLLIYCFCWKMTMYSIHLKLTRFRIHQSSITLEDKWWDCRVSRQCRQGNPRC